MLFKIYRYRKLVEKTTRRWQSACSGASSCCWSHSRQSLQCS